MVQTLPPREMFLRAGGVSHLSITRGFPVMTGEMSAPPDHTEREGL